APRFASEQRQPLVVRDGLQEVRQRLLVRGGGIVTGGIRRGGKRPVPEVEASLVHGEPSPPRREPSPLPLPSAGRGLVLHKNRKTLKRGTREARPPPARGAPRPRAPAPPHPPT